MTFRIRTVSTGTPGKRLADRATALHPNWSEHVVTVAAASIAVLIVATIAVLMGMA